jgi:hypothetical protein
LRSRCEHYVREESAKISKRVDVALVNWVEGPAKNYAGQWWNVCLR